jgi:hypothetical protein
MTTVHKTTLLMDSLRRKSPRQVYLDACQEHSVRPQRKFANMLSNIMGDFANMTKLVCNNILFGVRGCIPLIAVIQCSRGIRTLELRGIGAQDEFITQLVEVLEEHSSIRSIDLCNNPLITVCSGSPIVKLVEMNSNLVAFKLSGTHIGDNVAKVIQSRCDANKLKMMSYFQDDFFKMKDAFITLDADGSGWVHIKQIVYAIPAPIVQERLVERIAVKRPKKRADNCIEINTFMTLVYINYKTVDEIFEYAKSAKDELRDIIVENWKKLLKQLTARKASCADLHRIRIRDFYIGDHEAAAIADAAVSAARDLGVAPIGGVLQVPVEELLTARRSVFPPRKGTGKVYRFLKDRGDDQYDSNINLAANEVRSNISTPMMSNLGDGEEDDDPPHTWKMPPQFVAKIIAFFNGREGCPVEEILDQQFEGELEWLRVSALCDCFAKHSIPIEDSRLTLQEVVNLLDEQYDVIRVDKVIPLSDLVKILS